LLHFLTLVSTKVQLLVAMLMKPGFGILTDLILALIPIPMLYKLQMNWKVKLAVCGVLSLGLLYVTISPFPHFDTVVKAYGLRADI